MRKTRHNLKRAPAEPSARTLRLLVSWEKKYGLDVIRQHLDDGLFSRDKVEHLLCYRWLAQRKAARRNNLIVEVVLGVALVLGVGSALMCWQWART